MSVKISMDEWLSEIEKLEKEAIKKSKIVDGFTLNELAERTSFPLTRVIKLVKKAHAIGRIQVSKEIRVGLLGQSYWAPVYKIISEKKAKK